MRLSPIAQIWLFHASFCIYTNNEVQHRCAVPTTVTQCVASMSLDTMTMSHGSLAKGIPVDR